MRLFRLWIVIVFGVSLFTGNGQAKSFNELFSEVIRSDPRIVQARMSYQISTNNLRSSYGEWLPAVDLSGHYGYEEIRNMRSANTYFMARKFQAKITQNLFNLSKIIGVKSASKNREISGLSLSSIEQTIALEAISAYFNLVRTHRQLNYAKISENNILTQAGKEKTRVEKGSGVATNVLQINQQLYGARANRVNAERNYQSAINNYKRVFKEEFKDPKNLKLPLVPYGKVPKTMDLYIEAVLQNNLNMKQSRLAVELAQLSQTSSKSSYLPDIKLIGQSQFKEDEAGTEFGKHEHVVKVDFTYNIFNGGKDFYANMNKKIQVRLASETLKNTSEVIEENARNYWENYVSSDKRARYLHRQAKTAEEFLEKAKKERKLGKRSLIDVLNGETNYINAISGAISADIDMALAGYNMIFLMSELDKKTVLAYETPKKEEPSALAPKEQ